MRIQRGRGLVAHGELHGLAHLFSRCAVDDLKNILHLETRGFRAFPTRHLFGDRIHIGHLVFRIGTDDRITDRIQCDARAVLFLVEQCSGLVSLDDGAQRLGEQIVVAVPLEEIVVCTLPQSYAGHHLVLSVGQDEYGNVRRRAEELRECIQARAVRQIEVSQHCGHIAGGAPGETRQPIGPAPHPVNMKQTFAASHQCIADRPGIRRIRDQQDVVMNGAPLLPVNS